MSKKHKSHKSHKTHHEIQKFRNSQREVMHFTQPSKRLLRTPPKIPDISLKLALTKPLIPDHIKKLGAAIVGIDHARRSALPLKKYPVLYSDKRKHKPIGVSRSMMRSGVAAHIGADQSKKSKALKDGTKAKLVFDKPLRNEVCIRRKKRREVLFAMGKLGKGTGRYFDRKYNEDSEIKC